MAEGRRQGRAGGALSRHQVLDVAMEILSAEGIDRLTVRGLAARLDVAVTAVYWHVGDKQALLDGLVDRIIEEFETVSVRGRSAEARLVSLGRSLHRSLQERPNHVAVVHRQGRIAALFQPARRLLVRELVAAGLDGRSVAVAVQAVLNLVVGSVLIERQVERQPTQLEDPQVLWTMDDMPGSAEVLAYLTRPVDADEVFTYSLRALVRAVLAGAPGRTE